MTRPIRLLGRLMLHPARAFALAVLAALPASADCLDPVQIDPPTPVAHFYKVRMFHPGNILAIGSGFAMTSRDSGKTWKLLDIKTSTAAPDLYHASDILDTATAVVAGDGGILHVTRDGAKTWRSVPTGLARITMVQRGPGGALYLQSGDKLMLRMDDLEATPKPLYDAWRTGATIPFDDRTAVSATSSERRGEWSCTLQRSDNGGSSIEITPVPATGVFWLEKESDTSAYLLMPDRYYVTRDRGATWDEGRTHFRLSPQFGLYRGNTNPENLWLDSTLGLKGWSNGEMHRTTDGGNTWVQVLPKRTLPGGSVLRWVSNRDGDGFILTPAFSIIRIGNKGRAWENVPSPSDTGLQNILRRSPGLAMDWNGELAVFGDSGGFYRKRDSAGPWQAVNLPTRARLTHAQFVGDSTIYAAGLAEPGTLNKPMVFLKSPDGGGTWNVVPHSHRTAIEGMKFMDPMKGHIVTEGKLYATSDGGQTWTAFHHDRFSAVREFHFLPGGKAYVLMGTNDLYESRDGGATWTRQQDVNSPLNNRIGNMWILDSLKFALTGYDGYDRVLTTADGGRTWTLHDFVPNQPLIFFGEGILGITPTAVFWGNLGGCFDPPVSVLGRSAAGAGLRTALSAHPIPMFGYPDGRIGDVLGRSPRVKGGPARLPAR